MNSGEHPRVLDARGLQARGISLEDVRDGVRSVAEAHTSEQLRRAAVPDFELNVPIVDAQQRAIAIADILWRALRAILEIDSHWFHFSAEDWRQTTYRHNRLTACGFGSRTIRRPASSAASNGREVTGWLQARALELRGPVRDWFPRHSKRIAASAALRYGAVRASS